MRNKDYKGGGSDDGGKEGEGARGK